MKMTINAGNYEKNTENVPKTTENTEIKWRQTTENSSKPSKHVENTVS